jgi:hypothetical protein
MRTNYIYSFTSFIAIKTSIIRAGGRKGQHVQDVTTDISVML